MTTKADLRRQMLAKRRAMTLNDVAAKSRAVGERLRTMDALRGTPAILAYVPIHHEVDVLPLVADWLAEGRVVLIPLAGVTGGASSLTWRPLQTLTELGEPLSHVPATEPGQIVQPPAGAPVLVPGVAFSRKGDRLGFGGGYFDRFLAGHGGPSLGIAYEWQVLPSIPTESHDTPVDMIVTEAGVYQANRRHQG